MARELHACLVHYFARLEKQHDNWSELSRRAERPLEALANQAEQLRLVSASEHLAGVEESLEEEKREKLKYKILMGFETELALILDVLRQFNDANQDLRNHLINLECARSKVSLKDKTMRELIDGTPRRPKLDLLLEWAMESFQFYHNMYLCIGECAKSLDYKIEKTIDNLISCFAKEKRGRQNINRILAFTQFLAKETLR